MSYGKDKPDKWSSCSDADFKKWWKQRGHECVKKSESDDDDRGKQAGAELCQAQCSLSYPLAVA